MLFECSDCGHQMEGEYVAGDDWPDGVLRGIGPNCPVCLEEGAEIPMTAMED